MRIDVQSRINVQSGSLAIIPIENLVDIINNLSSKEFDEFDIMKFLIDNNGDCVSMEPLQEVTVGKIYTLDKDGGNSTIIRITPTINNSKRILKIGEKTAQEYCLDKKKELNIKEEDLGNFFYKQLEKYKMEMLSGE